MKLHPVATAEPVDWPKKPDFKLPCGKVLHKPREYEMRNVEVRGLPEWNTFTDCIRCISAAEQAFDPEENGRAASFIPKLRYISIIGEGQEVRDQEASG